MRCGPEVPRLNHEEVEPELPVRRPNRSADGLGPNGIPACYRGFYYWLTKKYDEKGEFRPERTPTSAEDELWIPEIVAHKWRDGGCKESIGQLLNTSWFGSPGIVKPDYGAGEELEVIGVDVHIERPDKKILLPEPSLRLAHHSVNFDWGYSGEGPAQLALALLFHHTGQATTALSCYRKFMWDVVVCWPKRGTWVFRSEEMDLWLERNSYPLFQSVPHLLPPPRFPFTPHHLLYPPTDATVASGQVKERD